jgi:Leucine-rich repeat (LRR) protein
VWTKVESISALENLTNLKWLDLHGTEVDNIYALAKLTRLESLNLGFTRFVDISALENLTNLKKLYINTLTHVSALKKKLPNLVIHEL